MSTISAGPSSTATVPARPMISARRGLLLAAFAAAGLLLAIGAGLLLATSDHLVDPLAYGIQRAVIIVGWSSAALYWLVRRPGNRLGLAFVALALASGVMSLQGASNPLLHSIGVFGDFPSFVLAYYVIFAFPDGRLTGTPERLLLAGWALSFFTSSFPQLFFSPVVSGGGPIAGCNSACPTNAFMIADRPTIANGLGSNGSYLVLALGVGTLAVLFYRLATATRPRRRALIPVYVVAVMLTVPVLIFHGVVGDRLDVDPSTISDVGWFLSVGRALLPYGFVLSIVVSTFFAATALKKIVSRLVESPSAAQLRTTLADALDDPSLELGFRLDQADGFVDSAGKPLPSTPPAGRSSTPVTRNGETVAVIIHDPGLDADPELVAAAGQALLLAIENGRLTTELQYERRARRRARSSAQRVHASWPQATPSAARSSATSMTEHSNIWSHLATRSAWPANLRIQSSHSGSTTSAKSSKRFCWSSATSPMASTRLCFASSDCGKLWPASCGVRLHRQSSRHQRSAATPKTWRPPSTSAAWRASRTPPSTPVRVRPRQFDSGSAMADSSSRSWTMAQASMSSRPGGQATASRI